MSVLDEELPPDPDEGAHTVYDTRDGDAVYRELCVRYLTDGHDVDIDAFRQRFITEHPESSFAGVRVDVEPDGDGSVVTVTGTAATASSI